MGFLKGMAVQVILLTALAHYVYVNAGCKPCFCNGNVLRCVGITINNLPHLDSEEKGEIGIVVLRGTSINRLTLDDMGNLQEIFIYNNNRLTCSTIQEFQTNHPDIKVHSDCDLDGSSTTTTCSDPATTSERLPKKKETTTPDIDITLTTEAVSINVIVPSATTLENTTFAIQYGDYKLKIVTGSTIAICIIVLSSIIGLIY